MTPKRIAELREDMDIAKLTPNNAFYASRGGSAFMVLHRDEVLYLLECADVVRQEKQKGPRVARGPIRVGGNRNACIYTD